ncbi:protein kinase domain-containing protein [Lacisediminihabitans profunda]|uniref:Protein kinase n=1 Tax=Lacisediminihabitans profunda TaxID=2594790 RepID=A0A5C8UVY8_9MICO|nr:protein kinase [Lacisediminihabitans profunda]TXN32159.1 protein kinase [Lacisediminihabitans profunda]
MESVGGYRLVRKLGEGERAEVFLGHAGSDAAPRPDRTAAIKLYRSTTPLQSIDTEIEALARVSARHIVELRDLAIVGDGRPCLILPRLGASSLGRVLAERSTIDEGEAVTALVPVVEAVGELHRLGVAHGALRLSSVLLDHVGAPVVAGFGSAHLIGSLPADPRGRSLTPAQLSDDPWVARDLDALVDLVHTVLARVAPAGHRPAHVALLDWLQSFDRVENAHDFPRQLAERVFAVAPALPLDLDGPAAERRPPRLPGRLDAVQGDAWRQSRPDDGAGAPSSFPPATSRSATIRRRVHRSSAGNGSEGARDQPNLGFPAGDLERLRERLRRSLAGVRRPVWVGGAAGLVALVLAVALLAPAGSATPARGRVAEPSGAATPARSGAAGTSASPSAGDSAAIGSDDPAAASMALLAARAACIEGLSVQCLDSVDQAGSAAIEADENLIRTAQQDRRTPAPMAADHAELVQRLGDSAMVRIVGSSGSPPASLLLVRGSAGWRIRDIAPG